MSLRYLVETLAPFWVTVDNGPAECFSPLHDLVVSQNGCCEVGQPSDEARRRPPAGRWSYVLKTLPVHTACCRAWCWTFPSVQCLATSAKTTTVNYYNRFISGTHALRGGRFLFLGQLRTKRGGGATVPLQVTREFLVTILRDNMTQSCMNRFANKTWLLRNSNFYN